MSLFPVIHPVPPPPSSFSGREKVAWIQGASRDALKACADRMGIKLGKLKKNYKGAPVPFNGIYWSVSHKPLFAAAFIMEYSPDTWYAKVGKLNSDLILLIISR